MNTRTVTLGEAYQALSKDPVVKFWALVRIAHYNGGCNLPCCSGRWNRTFTRWLRCKGRGIAACLGSRP